MNLYLLRHGIAADRGDPKYPSDDARPLTIEGKRKMLQAAKGMKTLGLEFDLILSSPILRAKQTAEIAAAVFDLEKYLRFSQHLGGGGDPRLLIKEICGEHSNRNDILLVGHEPYLSALVSKLVCGDEGIAIDFKKGGLCLLAIESLRWGKCAALCWLLTPGQLRAVK
ncbi:MAG: phosphohistidine phosphatase SixA [Candidatus Edwardsbacteria bacterium]|nr:phosphohistidine phosphatase SixA [Candidatus Edwardsbacteria bacterium]